MAETTQSKIMILEFQLVN